MIMVVGEYAKKELGGESTIDGFGFNVSQEVAKFGISVSLETLISSDDTGVAVLASPFSLTR